MFKSPFLHLILLILIIALFTLLGPEEKSLGANVHIVYLHGAWVLTAIVALASAGLAGLIARWWYRAARA